MHHWLRYRLAQRRGRKQLADFAFDNLDETAKIVVTTQMDEPVKVIDDPDTIAAVLAQTRRQQGGWQVPLAGVPIAPLRLNFYDHQNEFLGNLGIAETFLTTLQDGAFWSKNIKRDEFAALWQLLGLEE